LIESNFFDHFSVFIKFVKMQGRHIKKKISGNKNKIQKVCWFTICVLFFIEFFSLKKYWKKEINR
jgi:hypothetical protein